MRPNPFFKKYLQIKKNIDFFNFFSFIFCIVKIDYCFNVLPIYERFQIWFFHEFFIIFCQKESFFFKNWQFLIIFSIDNHFFAPNSWENVLWTFKYQFWETIFCDQNDILRAKNEKHNFFFISSNNELFCLKHKCFWFSDFEILFWSQKKWTSQSDVWKSIGPFLKILEPKNDYSC